MKKAKFDALEGVASESSVLALEEIIASLGGVSSRTEMKAITDMSPGQNCYLTESGREGTFIWRTGDYSSQIAADTAEGIYVKATAIASTSGAWVRAFNGAASARWFGSGQAAIVAAHAVVDDIIIDQNFAITSTATWPNGKSYLFLNGGKLSVATGITLTIRGTVNAGVWRGLPSSMPQKIFDCAGTGKVIGLGYALPEWWGAVGNYLTTNDQPALQAAHDCIEASYGSDVIGRPTLELRAGAQYGIGTTWTIRPTHVFQPRIIGGGSTLGTRIWARTSFSGTIAILIDGQVSSPNYITDFEFSDFSVYPQTGTTAIAGIQIGSSGKTLIGYKATVVRNILVGPFTYGWTLRGCRLLKFDSCSAWVDTTASSQALRIIDNGAGSFTGDLDFENCEFVAPVTSGSCVFIQCATSAAQIKGVRFSGCPFYKGAEYFSIQASGGGIIGDIWIHDGCQFDGFGRTQLRINANGSGTVIDDIQVIGNYFRGVESNYKAIQVTGDGVARISNLLINNNWFANVAGIAVELSAVVGVSFNQNQFLDIENFSAADAAVRITGCQRVTANANVLTRSGAQQLQYFIFFDSCNYYTAVGNIAGGIVATSVIREATAGANKYLAGNI